MPACNNCGSFVTDAYVRVFSPNDQKTVRVCPNCEDRVRDGADVRRAKTAGR